MKKKDFIFYAGAAVLLAFSTQQAKADEKGTSDQTPENTSAIVAKTTTSSEAQNTVNEGVGVEKGVQTENTVATETAPITPTISDNPSSEQVTSEKGATEHPAPAVVASRAPYGARARVVETENNSLPTEEVQKPSGTLTVENNNTENGTFEAVVRNVVAPNGLKEVLIPTWSEANGQDDLIWHKAIRQSDGSYRATIKASDHKNEDGKYNVHVHFIDTNNHRTYITETTTEVHHVKPSGTVTIENNNTETGTFDAVIRNVVAPNGLKEVLVPAWSNENGQDDLVWHKAVRQSDGSYRATIKTSDHKNDDGKFNVHVYYVDQNNKRTYITETTTEVHEVKPSGTVTIENNNTVTGTFEAVVRDVVAPNGLKEVLIPTW